MSVMTETMLIIVYRIVDDFIYALLKTQSGQEAYNSRLGSCGPKPRPALAEIITLNILRFYYHIQDLKAFHRLARQTYQTYFPGLPNYENFLKGMNKSMPLVLLFLRCFLLINRKTRAGGLFFMDWTPLRV
jgi:hypothetical protein